MDNIKLVRGFVFLGVLFMTFMVIISFVQVEYASRAEDYVPNDAVVINQEIDMVKNDDRPSTYIPIITYSYVVEGVTYQNDDLTTRTIELSTYSAAEEVLNTYPVGENITIYYDVEYPQNSVINKGVNPTVKSDHEYFKSILFYSTVIYALLLIPEAYVTWKKDHIVDKIESGELQGVPPDSYYDYDTSAKYRSYRNSQVVGSPESEKIARMAQKFKDVMMGYLALFFIGFHEIAIVVLINGSFETPDWYTELTGSTIEQELVFTICWTIVAIGAVLSVIYSFLEDMGSSWKGNLLVGIIAYPIFALVGLMFLIVFIFLIGLLGFVGTFFYFVSEPLLISYTGDLDFEQKMLYFAIYFFTGMIVFALSANWHSRVESRYSIIRKGHDILRRVYFTGVNEIYCIDGPNPIVIGTRKGSVVWVEPKSGMVLGRFQIHDGAITGIRLMGSYIVTSSTDKTLKVLHNDNMVPVSSLEVDLYPRVIQSSGDLVLVGYDDGSVEKFILKDDRLHSQQRQRIFSDKIQSILIDQEKALVGGYNNFIKVIDIRDLKIVTELMNQEGIISDIWTSDSEILSSSFDGSVAVYDRMTYEFLRKYRFRQQSKLTSVIEFGNYIFAGTDRGEVKVISKKDYKLEVRELANGRTSERFEGINKYDVHQLWVEDMILVDGDLYTISNDGSMKVLDTVSLIQ